MTQRNIFTALVAFALSSIVLADTSVQMIGGPAGLMNSGATGRKPGDIISVQTDSDAAALCSFDRQIVVTRTSILCVYNGK